MFAGKGLCCWTALASRLARDETHCCIYSQKKKSRAAVWNQLLGCFKMFQMRVIFFSVSLQYYICLLPYNKWNISQCACILPHFYCICIIFYITIDSQWTTTPSSIMQPDSWLELWVPWPTGRVCGRLSCQVSSRRNTGLCLPNLFVITSGFSLMSFPFF